jgi:hypothetical protein
MAQAVADAGHRARGLVIEVDDAGLGAGGAGVDTDRDDAGAGVAGTGQAAGDAPLAVAGPPVLADGGVRSSLKLPGASRVADR